MKYIIEKDKKKRIQFSKNENFVNAIKCLNYNRIDKNKKFYFQKKSFLFFENKTFSKTKIKNRCTMTGRPRSVIGGFFKLSRIKFRELASFGLLSGVRKSSW